MLQPYRGMALLNFYGGGVARPLAPSYVYLVKLSLRLRCVAPQMTYLGNNQVHSYRLPGAQRGLPGAPAIKLMFLTEN